MRIGMIGLGGMGGNLARRLMRGGHQVVAWDHGSEATEAVAPNGAIAVASIEDMAGQLTEHRTFWVMLPACEPTEQTVTMLGVTAAPGDIIIDGGSTFYKDDIRRSKMLATRGIDYVDVGTSGGVWGLERGYVHVGPAGAGHFVKMVHNGIEYGLMQAYAEGFDILKGRSSDKLAEVWRRGSVISSWLLDLSAAALARDHTLEYYSGHVADSGEGRWTADAAMEEAVPACVLSAALFARYRSRVETTFGDKLLSAMRFGFGGHIEIPQ